MRAAMANMAVTILLCGCFDEADTVDSTGTSTGDETTMTSGPSTTVTTTGTETMPMTTSDSTTSDSTTSDSTTSMMTTGVDSDSSTGGLPPAQTLFINFDATSLTAGPEDDAPNNTVMSGWEGDFDAHPRPSEIPTIVAEVQAHWAPFNVLATDERPMVAPYTMVVVTPSSPFPDFIFGSATEVDCGNQNPSNVVFAYTQTMVAPALVANAITGEVGRSLGLAYQMADDTDVMHLPYGASGRMFVDECLMFEPDPADPANDCVEQHAAQFCDPGTQNSFGEVEAMFGPA